MQKYLPLAWITTVQTSYCITQTNDKQKEKRDEEARDKQIDDRWVGGWVDGWESYRIKEMDETYKPTAIY